MTRRRRKCFWYSLLLVVAACHWTNGETTQLAYIGPGAGFAILGSFLTLLAGFFLSLASILAWPFRLLWRTLRGRRGYRNARIRKLIFLGLDGLDPNLAEQYMAAGLLPNLKRLREQGGYKRLRTTFPALSPVAWSTFATGVSPARHAMFDFLNRNLKSYLPELSSAVVRPPRRVLQIGRFHIPFSAPIVEMRRKSKAFWQVLSEHSISSTVLRVPITFPPERFDGRMLSAMCTPDLLGTQGTFSYFTTAGTQAMEGGNRCTLVRDGNAYRGEIEGPDNSLVAGAGAAKIPFVFEPRPDGIAKLIMGGQHHTLHINEYTTWLLLEFQLLPLMTIRGIARFLYRQNGDDVTLYMTPINIDPERPALPIAHPARYSTYLMKLLGRFATLGMAEDTWALNEKAIDEESFLKQAYLTFQEREAMFQSALDHTDRGVVACVFDTTDRVQHMFHRDMRHGGPHQRVIEELYRKADELVGRTLPHVDEHTVLFVLSDHGFASFDRAVNLNAWLLQNGYLALKPDAKDKGYLQDIDWSRTRAYTFGLAGIYINQHGRESEGIVSKSEAAALRDELASKLSGMRDEQLDAIAIRQAWTSPSLYNGPYLDSAPDVLIGYADGYRASWDAAIGKVTGEVIIDNPKAWSGDHCVDPHLVPGVLFCNRAIDAEDPGLEDMAPTALSLFGIEKPAYMEGRTVFAEGNA